MFRDTAHASFATGKMITHFVNLLVLPGVAFGSKQGDIRVSCYKKGLDIYKLNKQS